MNSIYLGSLLFVSTLDAVEQVYTPEQFLLRRLATVAEAIEGARASCEAVPTPTPPAQSTASALAITWTEEEWEPNPRPLFGGWSEPDDLARGPANSKTRWKWARAGRLARRRGAGKRVCHF